MKANNLIPLNNDKDITISLPDSIANSVTKQDLNILASFLQSKIPEMLSDSFEEIKASYEMQAKNTNKRFDDIENKVEQKEITSKQLDNLTDLVKKKATAYVKKYNVQITTDMYENDDFSLEYQKLVDKQVAKICRKIWRDLKVEVLDEKPSSFRKQEIKHIDVDRCSDYIRKWGGFIV